MARLSAALGALVAGCAPVSDTGTADSPGATSNVLGGPAQRVLLVTCDTLRADRLGAYGFGRDVSPALDAFAAESVLFEDAYSAAPLTVPALSSLLSGHLPDEVGVSRGNRHLMPPEVETVAELARAAGLPTGAVVSNWVLRRQPGRPDVGVQQGFAHFDDRMRSPEPNRPSFERTAPATTEAAVAWLEERRARGEERFFLWVHYQDPHGPYTPPEEVARRFRREPPPEEPRVPIGATVKGRGQIPSYQALDGEERAGVYTDLYDAEVRYFDDAFGELLAWLRRAGWIDDSLVVFTADHGESLGEHGFWFCHGENLAREVVRVPLVVRFPAAAGVVQPDRRCSAVSHLDLFPTILEALGLEAPARRGASLFRAVPQERVLVQMRGPRGTERRQIALTDGRYRLLRQGTQAPQLFDVVRDPGEARDLAPDELERVRELLGRWEELEATIDGSAEGLRRSLDADDLQALRALGYGGEPGEDDGASAEAGR